MTLDFDDIQGLILYGYDDLPVVRYLLLSIGSGDGARPWLGEIADRVATARPRGAADPRPDSALHVAITASGLLALGFDQSTINTFPTAFQTGMANPYRSKILGDVGPNLPKHWEFGGPPPATQIDILLIVHAKTQAILDQRVEAETARLRDAGLDVIKAEDGYRKADGREHFGFADGVSQPAIEGRLQDGHGDGQPPIKAGEFVLGYRNEYGELPFSPSVTQAQDPGSVLSQDVRNPLQHDLGRNGSLLVFRKYQQDVAAFWRFAVKNVPALPGGGEDYDAAVRMAACTVGRWPSGAPLALAPAKDDPALANENAFLYGQSDPRGLACPIGAHIRRSNPRDTLPPGKEESLAEARRHRILRRGRLFGPPKADLRSDEDDGIARGLYFVAINANLHRQFEFIQQTWVNNTKANRLHGDPDPLIGVDPADPHERNLTIQAEPVRRVYKLDSFVTVKGGAYFFLPGVRALRFMGGETYASKGGAVEESLFQVGEVG